MKLKIKLLIFLSILMLFPILAVIIGNHLFSVRKQAYQKDLLMQKKYSSKVSVDLTGEKFKNIAESYTFWDEFITEGIINKDSKFILSYFEPLVYFQSCEHIWATDMNLHISFHLFDTTKFDIPFPYTKKEIYKNIDSVKNSQKRYFTAFHKFKENYFQIFCMTIHRTLDTKKLNQPEGILIIANSIDSSYINKIQTITNSRVEITKDTLTKSVKANSQLVTYEPLSDCSGNVIGYLKFTEDDSFEKDEKLYNTITNLVVILLMILIIITLFIFLQSAIFTPVKKLTNSLQSENTNELSDLIKNKNEFGRISELIIKFFNQKEELKTKNSRLKELNEEINQQTEEIKTIADNLLTTTDKIKAANEEVTLVNDEINNKNQKLQNSFNYGLKIQQAILPKIELFDCLKESFVFYKPKDIVSGDFYYIKKNNHLIYLAAADCTGHGVPGAFMSMLGITYLNEIIQRTFPENAAEILNELRIQIKNSLQQTGQRGEQQDGLDIAFCIINSETKKISYAGAHNPLIIIKNAFHHNQSDSTNGFIHVDADLMPVGIYAKEKPFTEHILQLDSDDIIYIFSDGFYSQFGFEKNEKFKTKRFKKLLHDIHHLPLIEQKQILENNFNSWKDEKEQTDDVLVLGVKI